MESTADTGTKIDIPEGGLISIECLLGSDVWTRRKELCAAVSVHGLGRDLLEPRLAGGDWVCYCDHQL